jgi:RNA polymerase sigma factor (sigma-70 family)
LLDNSNITAILGGCRKNERNSQKELYNLLRGFAMKICYRYTNALEECEEIVNEGFVKLFKNIQQFDETRQEDTLLSLKGWFKRILINTCIDHYRKNNSSVNGHVLNHESESIPDRGETGIDVLSYKEIIEAIRLLSPAYRAVFNLFVIEGLSHEEISQTLGISVGASKSNLSKARDNLRKLLVNKNHFQTYESPPR